MLGGRANGTAFAVGAGTLAVILLLKGSKRVPGILVAVIGATVIVGTLDLATRAGVSVLGSLPQGLPAFAIPWITYADIGPVLIGGLAVALVSFADTSVLSRSYAARTRTYVDPNQEMVGLGAANLAAGFFQGFPISSSSSRTPVAEAAGARTQLAGVVGALSVALLLLVAPDLLQHLPSSALAAVVIASAIGLIEVADLRRIYRIQRWEFWLSIACTVGVAVLGAIPGIGLAIVIAVIEFLWDGWRPHSAVLGRAEGVKGYHDITRYPDARLIPGLVLFRWDAPLFFANAELFRDRALDAVAASPTPVNWLVVAAEPVTSVDVTAADVLAELDETLRAAGITLCFAEMKDPVKDKLKRFGLMERLAEQTFFPTVGAAVGGYRKTHAVDWVDWEAGAPEARSQATHRRVREERQRTHALARQPEYRVGQRRRQGRNAEFADAADRHAALCHGRARHDAHGHLRHLLQANHAVGIEVAPLRHAVAEGLLPVQRRVDPVHHAARELGLDVGRVHRQVAVDHHRHALDGKRRRAGAGDLDHRGHDAVERRADGDAACRAGGRLGAPVAECGGRLEHGEPTRVGESGAAELVRVLPSGGGQFVDHRLDGEGVDRRAHRAPEAHRDLRRVAHPLDESAAEAVGQRVRCLVALAVAPVAEHRPALPEDRR